MLSCRCLHIYVDCHARSGSSALIWELWERLTLSQPDHVQAVTP